jgi:predicted transcriptional regulator
VPSSDSFGTFLEARKLIRKGDKPEQQESAQQRADSDALTESAVVSLSLVRDHRFPISIHELLGQSELPLSEFTDALEAIHKAGLIEIERSDDGEIVQLTSKGEDFQEAAQGG